MNKKSLQVSISQTVFTAFFLVLFFTVLNGYVLNLVSGYRADSVLVLAGLIAELVAVAWFARRHIDVDREPLELAGFCIVVGGVWLYFVIASLPTFMPPTLSMDAVRHYLQAMFSYPKGTLVSWYPAGGAFVTAMLSNWTGLPVLRLLHPVAASFVALSAGAVYGMTCSLLPPQRVYRVIALIAPALLFVPWSYFAGIIDGEQYFFAQAFAQFFVVAALWYTSSFAEKQNWIYLVLIGACLAGIAAAYPYLIALPLALFVVIAIARFVSTRRKAPPTGVVHSSTNQSRALLAAIIVFVALMVAIAIALEQGGILEFNTWQIATEGDVGEGGVTNPSLGTLGGPLFLLLALTGLVLAWQAGAPGKTVLAFLLVWVMQLGVLLLAQPFFRISGYRLDKTFYVLVFPLAILGTLLPARVLKYVNDALTARRATSDAASQFVMPSAFLATVVVLSAGIAWLRPPVSFSPFTEAELQAALWAKRNLNTYEISYLDPLPVRAYWLAFGIWGETLPNEWFQWIPAGNKMGPKNFDEWLNDPAWPRWVLVRDMTGITAPTPRVVYRNEAAAILEKVKPPPPAPTPGNPAAMYFMSTLKLIGYDLAISPGDVLTLTTHVESLAPPDASVGWRVELIDRGRVISQAIGDPFGSKYPLQRWPPGRIETRSWSFPLDSQLPPGIYDLRLGLYERVKGDMVSAHPVESRAVKQPYYLTAPVGQVKLPPPPPSPEELQEATLLDAPVGESFVLSRYSLKFDRAERVARLTLYWRSLAPAGEDYTAFVHILDASGRVVAQKDAQPLDGRYPTSAWQAGQVISERYALSIPLDALAPFSIEMGMYAFPSLQRLAVNEADHILLPNAIQ